MVLAKWSVSKLKLQVKNEPKPGVCQLRTKLPSCPRLFLPLYIQFMSSLKDVCKTSLEPISITTLNAARCCVLNGLLMDLFLPSIVSQLLQ